MEENRRVVLSRPPTADVQVENEMENGDSESMVNVDNAKPSENNADSHVRLPPINTKVISPEPVIYRRPEKMVGPPVNRAQAMRFNKIRRDMSLRADYTPAPYLPKRYRNSRLSNYGGGSLDSSMSGIYRSELTSPARSRQSMATDSRYSAVHPLSIKSQEEMFHHGKTRWTKDRIRSKVGSLDNYYHIPGGGEKDIHEIKYHINAPNTISSRTRVVYGPRRHDSKNRSLDFDSDEYERLPNLKFRPKNVQSKCGSLDNINHRPGGGTKPIFTERMPWQDGYKHRR